MSIVTAVNLEEGMVTEYGIILDVYVEDDEVTVNINTGYEGETNTGEPEVEQFAFHITDQVTYFSD